MSDEYVLTLRRARENFVRKRRSLAEHMIPPGAAAAHFAPTFADLQAVIEALDRAILDEEQLPEGYAADGSEPVEGTSADGSNVVDVDFDPA
jgi:hypothetical protein